MNKNSKILTLVILILTALTAVFAYLNAGDIDYKKALEENAQFVVNSGETQFVVSMKDILTMGVTDFSATLDTSISSAKEVCLTGVNFQQIFDFLELDVSDATGFEVRALDGYASAVQENETGYLCIAMDGETLGTKSEGGMGPYLMVIEGLEFSQRWCKYVQEINVIW